MLDKLKALLGIEGEETDKLLSFALDTAKETICNYCHIKEVPEGLCMTQVRMAAEFYQNELSGEAGENAVSSVNLGDVTVAFGNTTATKRYQEGLMKNYRAQLNRYRRLG
ncbi:MAG: phage head-tail connector protein [Lachnospiraceae bacterium]|nr:phage head-tail connector protein [Lachnospiraceae bacterium]